jgi:mono/diheme cytochrome c family protein
MRHRTRIILASAVVIVIAAVIMVMQTLRYGFSAHDEPTRIEAMMAGMMRRYSVPADLRDAKNPVPLTPEVLAEARAHFADHCATCHGNDGKGQTEMGPRFYPKVPDMTLPATQTQSDGELFATIENGVRMTGMPGWGEGTAESARGSWTLVHFIRHLPKITAEELAEMEELNPKPPEERAEMKAEEEFLSGGDTAPSTQQHQQH